MNQDNSTINGRASQLESKRIEMIEYAESAYQKIIAKTPCWLWQEEEVKSLKLYNNDYYSSCLRIRKTPCTKLCTDRICIVSCSRSYFERIFSSKDIIGDLIYYEMILKFPFILVKRLIRDYGFYRNEIDCLNEHIGFLSKIYEESQSKLEQLNNAHPGQSTISYKKAAVWDKTGGKCWYCGRYIHPFLDFEIDHFHPKSKGGSDELYNLVPSCRTCNRVKKDSNIEEFREKFLTKSLANLSDTQKSFLRMLSPLVEEEHPSKIENREVRNQALRLRQDALRFYFEKQSLQALLLPPAE